MNLPDEAEWLEFTLYSLNEDKCIVYALYDQNDKLVYIGRTQSFLHRMTFHKIDKKFVKKIRYFITEQNISEELEQILIQKYNPILNKNKKHKENLRKREKLPAITQEEVKKFFLDKNVDISFFSQKTGYTQKFLRSLVEGTKKLTQRTAENFRTLMKVYNKYWVNEYNSS